MRGPLRAVFWATRSRCVPFLRLYSLRVAESLRAHFQMNSHQFAAAMLEEEITGEPFPRVLLQMAKAFSNIDSDDKLCGRFAYPAVSHTQPC
jgi:hypothetical protein